MEIAKADGKRALGVHINVMGVAGAVTIAVKFAVLDQDVATESACQHAFLVVVKINAPQGEVYSRKADGTAVSVRHRRPGHLEVFHGKVVPINSPDALVVRIPAGGFDTRPAVDAPHQQVVSSERTNIALVGSRRIDLNRVAVLGDRQRLTRGLKLPVRPDGQGFSL